jgi:hypothetical protein
MSVLEQVMDQISQDMPCGTRLDVEQVEIGLVTYEPGVAQDIELRYGGHPVEVLTRDEPFVEPC